MRNSKPLIGITGPDKGGAAAWWLTRFGVWQAGGRAVRITPAREGGGVEALALDGLIVGGGADVDPKLYGESLLEDRPGKPKLTGGVIRRLRRLLGWILYPVLLLLRKVLSAKEAGIDKRRDDQEFRLLREAMERRLPILGICRGAQLLNVLQGGSLHQDISGYYTELPQVHSIWPRKRVCIVEGTKLAGILRVERALVNALHNQAVDELGEGLRVAAREENGVVQAIENAHYPFMLGVQWHPEYMPQLPVQRRIFKELVRAARLRLTTAAEEPGQNH